ncbi:sigma-70 family RNA polymerase sigma factor [Caulobacter sp. 73W]|uniref:Sigma-70 family RNA polymerase sigma factor n=1 Tax=Caulobacter sp. 73W TaxID=3161137 RepID=A0AB39KXF2_9CAUL
MGGDTSVVRFAEGRAQADLLRHRDWLKRFVSARFPNSNGDDVVQEVFVRLTARQTLDLVRRPKAYLARVAIGIVQDQWRRKSVRDAAQPELAYTAPSHLNADQEELVFLKQLVGSLPPDCREIFILQRLYGLTYVQIARQTGLSLKAVEGRMTKALALCARKMAD